MLVIALDLKCWHLQNWTQWAKSFMVHVPELCKVEARLYQQKLRSCGTPRYFREPGRKKGAEGQENRGDLS